MDTIRKESEQSINKNGDAVKAFFSRMGDLSQVQKIKLIYTYFANKKPDPQITEDKLINRILYELEFGKKIKETEKDLKKQKRFKFPWNQRKEMDSAKKKKDMVLVFYLNMKNELEWPKLYPIYGSNMVIIRSKPYFFDPRAVLSFGKYKCIIYREMDRKPISNMDYADVKARGDSTESDELLIKAALKAYMGAPKKEMDKKWIIIIVIIAIIALLYFMMKK